MSEEIAKAALLSPTPELPDDTPIELMDLTPRIQAVLKAEGLKTAGEIREKADDHLLSVQHLGAGSIAYLRETLGLPSCDGVRSTTGPKVKK
jgi:DNA-directed RNA polymerase alpha subunit